MDNIIKTAVAVICGAASFLWGKADGMIYALLAFVTIDYITGVLVAVARKQLSSEVGARGLAKKGLILAVVAVAHVLDSQMLGGASACRSAVIGYYIANEGISILENAGNLGVPLPKRLLKVLEQLRDNGNKEDN